MKVKEENEKVGLKLNILETKIMAADLITSWQIDGETMETVRDYSHFGGAPKSLQMVTAAMKRSLLLGSKVMANLDSILKSRDITLQQMPILSKLWIFW